MNRLLVGAIIAASLTLSANALAEIGDAQRFVLSAERITGVYYYRLAADMPGGNLKLSGVDVGLFGSVQQSGPMAMPRLSWDGFVIKSLSIGGSASFYSASKDFKLDKTDAGDTRIWGFGVTPRVGWLFDLPSIWSIWLRGGPSFLVQSEKSSEQSDANLWIMTVDVDAMFNVSFVDNFGINFGPNVAIPVIGKTKKQNNKYDTSYFAIGLSIGVYGAL